MKKNGAFVNLFLSGGLQKSPKCRGQPKKLERNCYVSVNWKPLLREIRNFITQISKLFTFTGSTAAKTA